MELMRLYTSPYPINHVETMCPDDGACLIVGIAAGPARAVIDFGLRVRGPEGVGFKVEGSAIYLLPETPA